MASDPAATDAPAQFGPERLVLFHSPDPAELGIELEHGRDGYVRIVSVPSDNDEGGDGNDGNNGGNNGSNNDAGFAGQGGTVGNRGHVRKPSLMGPDAGVVEGKIRVGDVLCEAAGVNMRRPISEHMWNLTTNLMKVAQRPIEVVVAEAREPGSLGAGLNGSEDSAEAAGDGASDGSYYQLEVSPRSPGEASGHEANDIQVDARVRHLPGSPGALSPVTPVTPGSPAPAPAAIRNPFQDRNRFGPERRITFNTESLGIKLHRSPTEGIVHILHVAPFRPFVLGGANSDYHPAPREGPDDGHLEPGDTIFEVGGVDLRGKAIGVAEWADMVHFIKHVGRPLEMVVSKDGLFTRERVGLAREDERANEERQMMLEESRREAQGGEEEDEKKDGKGAGDAQDEETQAPGAPGGGREESVEVKLDPFDETLGGAGEGAEDDEEIEIVKMENVCYSVAMDDVCGLPCKPAVAKEPEGAPVWEKPTSPEGNDAAPVSDQATSPEMKDASPVWKKPASPERNDGTPAWKKPTSPQKNEASPVGTVRAKPTSPERKGASPWKKSTSSTRNDASPVRTKPTPLTPPTGTDAPPAWKRPTSLLRKDASPWKKPAPSKRNDDSWIRATSAKSSDRSWIMAAPADEDGGVDDAGKMASNASDEAAKDAGRVALPLSIKNDRPWIRNSLLDDVADTPLSPIELSPVEDAPPSPAGNGISLVHNSVPVDSDGTPTAVEDAWEGGEDAPDSSPEPFDAPGNNDVSGIDNSAPADEAEAEIVPPTPPLLRTARRRHAEDARGDGDAPEGTGGGLGDDAWENAFDATWPEEGDFEDAGPNIDGAEPEEARVPEEDASKNQSVPPTVSPLKDDASDSKLTVDALMDLGRNEGATAQLRDMFSPLKPPASFLHSTTNSSIHAKESWHTAQARDSFQTALSSSPVVSTEERREDSGISASPIWKVPETPSAVQEEATKEEEAAPAPLTSLFSPIVAEPVTPESPVVAAPRPAPDDAAGWPSPIISAAAPPTSPRPAEPLSNLNATSPISDASAASAHSAWVVSSIDSPLEHANDSDDKAQEALAVTGSLPKKRQEMAQAVLNEKSQVEDDQPGTPPPAVDAGMDLPKPDPSPGVEIPKLEPTPYGKQPAHDESVYYTVKEEDQSTATSEYGVQNPKLESTSYGKQQLFNEMNTTIESHDLFLQNLRKEFDSPDSTLQSTKESRDDITSDKHRRHQRTDEDGTPMANNKSTSFGKKHGNEKFAANPDKNNHTLAGRTPQKRQQPAQSPTGSTVSVEDKKKASWPPPSAERKSVPFSERSFRTVDGLPDSPFVGDVRFATPAQRVPSSALFSQAFVVQPPQEGAGGEGATNVRWAQTDSLLFVSKKKVDDAAAAEDGGGEDKSAAAKKLSYLQLRSPMMQPPEMPDPDPSKGFDKNQSAFDMSVVEMDDAVNTSFELNDTIVYADNTEDALADCCGRVADSLCGADSMFEGLIGTCGGGSALEKPPQRQAKEKGKRIPSPRRKGLLGRLRGRGKSKKASKADKKLESYGNLDEDNEAREESSNMKGIRKAQVQLVYQNIRGQRVASANQFALLLDDEICV